MTTMKINDHNLKYYGSTVLGEKGQVVIPAKIREKFGLATGDKFLVLTGEEIGGWAVVMVKADVLSGVVGKMFGGSPRDIASEIAPALKKKNKMKKKK